MSDLDRLTSALADRYRIERELGAGGMATVYLAEDLKHDRQVALKVLKPELAAVLGAERFVVEIKTTASLQHPHILPLFDSGTADGFLFYVMPYVAGETIREKLSRETQFGVDDAVRIAREIADALDYAHRHGVIHRDIKPENILLHDGRAIVMDFGIALALSAAAGGRMTETGLSLGTPHYMSPEQATAEKVLTPRSDIYSLASVLYEMLSGQPPHLGGSAQQIIMKIIAEPVPPVSTLRKSVPPNVAAAVAKALEKLPADRFDSAKSFGDALANVSFTTTSAGGWPGGANVERASRRREFVAWALVAGLAAVAAWAFLRPRADSAPPSPPVKFELPLPAELPIGVGTGPELALSPDGRTLVYSAQGPNGILLARHAMGETGGTPIAGTEKALHFTLSPNGRWVAFFADSQLKKVPIEGGLPTQITNTPAGALSWGPNDVIVVGDPGDPSGGLRRVAAAGGTVRQITKADSANGERSARWPRALADGKTVLYASYPATGGSPRIAIAPVETGEATVLDVAGTYPFGVFDRQLVYARGDGAIMAVPIDLRGRHITGEPQMLLDAVAIGAAGASKATLSANGTLVFETGNGTQNLVLVDLAGASRIIANSVRVNSPRFSPDGKRIAVSVGDLTLAHADVWVFDNGGATKIKLPSADTIRRTNPEWTADGKRLLFLSGNRGQPAAVFSQAADGSAPAERLGGGLDQGPVAMSRDGRTIVETRGRSGSRDIWYRSTTGDTTPKPLVTSPADEYAPALSPDAKWLAYVSNETGVEEVYVRAFPGPVSKIPVSAGGGSEPRWAPDGRHIYYRSPAPLSKLMAATVATTPGFAVTARTALFDDRFRRANRATALYDVSPDGKGFVMTSVGDSASKVMGIVNFLSQLHQSAAAGKK